MIQQTANRRLGLRRRIIEAASWVLGGHGAAMAIRLASNLLMTRLLFPEAFGLMAVVISIHIGLALLTDAGIKGAIIRSASGEDDEFLRSAWTLQVMRGVVIWLMVLGVAGMLSLGAEYRWMPEQSTLAHPLMPALLAAVGASSVLHGLESVNLHVSARRIDLGRLVMIGVGARIVSIPVMLLWVLYDPSVWALMAGLIAGALCRLVLSHTIIPGPRMGFLWHRAHVRELFHFGKWITVSSTATFISNNSDRLILGFLLPSGVLGLYAIARLLSESFEGVMQRLHHSLTQPVLVEVLRERPETLQDKYYRFRTPIEAGGFLVAGVLLVAGPGIVDFLYDDRYREAGLMLQILALSLVVAPFQFILHGFLATGETRTVAAVSILHAIFLVAALPTGYIFGGLEGAIFGIALHRVPATLVTLAIAHRRGWISPWREVRFVPLVAVGAAAGYAGTVAGQAWGLIA